MVPLSTGSGDNEMNNAESLLIILLIIYIQACSSRQVYDSIQHSQKLECQKVPYSEYDECIERTNESYDNYKQKREEVIKGK